MKIKIELLTLLLVCWYDNSEAQISAFDQFVPQYRIFLDAFLKAMTPSSKSPRNLRLADDLHKLQPRIADDVPFPCPLKNTRSEQRPKSVHALRPGDIDVVGAMGDSLIAGHGLTATNLLQVTLQNRGISFAIGGQGTWRQFLTLPNILKEFNPHLIGYSLEDSYGHQKGAQFNTAEASVISLNTPYMAKVLVKRMESDPRVNITRDWKMISYMIGANDFCSEVCYRKNPEEIIEEHKSHLIKVLRTLRDNLPRTIVNVIIAPNIQKLVNFTLSNRPPYCYVTHNFLCPCIFGLQFEHLQKKIGQIIVKWQQTELEVVNDSEFDREDFTVVAQPFGINYKLHTTKDGLTDYTGLSPDCFHMSQREGARAALSLWNNILEPVGSKTAQVSDLSNFKCPTHDSPFLFTRRNSI